MNKIFLFMFLIFIPLNVRAIVKPTKDFYVNDYANVLSHETEEYILNKSLALNKIDGTQIVVLTVKELDGLSIEDYAYNYFNENGIGDKDKKNGLLILISVSDRKSRIEVGNGLENILTDGKTGRFQDEYMISYLNKSHFNDAIKNGYNAFYSEIVKSNDLNLSYNNPIYKPVYLDKFDKLIPFMIFAILGGSIMGGLFRDGTKLIPIVISIAVFHLPIFLKDFLIITTLYLIFFIVGYFYKFINNNFGWLSSSKKNSSGGRISGGGGSSSGGGSSRNF